MIINRRIDGITTMTRLFVYKIVVLNNIFPSTVCIQFKFVYICNAYVEKRKKMERFLHFIIGFFLLWKYTKKVCTII